MTSRGGRICFGSSATSCEQRTLRFEELLRPRLASCLRKALGQIGIGAVGGSLALRWLKDELGPDRLVAAGSLGTAIALVMFGLAHEPVTAVAACLVGGASWTVVMTKL